jgi:hypothetical protein
VVRSKESEMRRRFGLFTSLVVLGLALMLPAQTAAATAGRISFHDGYCSGANTITGTFTVTKVDGVHGTKLTLTIKGQGYHNGAWRTETTFGTWSKTFNTSNRVALSHSVTFKPGHSGRHRLQGVGKIYDGTFLVASGKLSSPACS